ncbi:hypothetical protein [Melittangium boletus]|uniref:Uncharacterized protein n=1 Tax=Melittangium boletus DSM 14713 TaxID=1294270 RepID=A0A250I8N8_9BACT|nr:hypothetical protein [Melittangium boletus]ATB27570.1 hypothetical protein MEBOL_001014 [Melittangium boletus DSM 14713]
MSTHEKEQGLPSLPPEASAALSALRDERPSPHLEYRLHMALQSAEAARSAPRAKSPAEFRERAKNAVHHPANRGLLSVALVSLLVLLVVHVDGWEDSLEVKSETMPLRHVSLRIPGDGAGWLELPWTHGVHSGEPATVRFDAPAELNFHRHADSLPSLQLLSCDAGRCIHQFTADTGEGATPLRVRIDKPGRYEFHLSHASDSRQVQERFVVLAEH